MRAADRNSSIFLDLFNLINFLCNSELLLATATPHYESCFFSDHFITHDNDNIRSNFNIKQWFSIWIEYSLGEMYINIIEK